MTDPARPTWRQLCDKHASEGKDAESIKIVMSCGLTIEGRLRLEDAKLLFRQPGSPLPISRHPQDGEVLVVFPISDVVSLEFPPK